MILGEKISIVKKIHTFLCHVISLWVGLLTCQQVCFHIVWKSVSFFIYGNLFLLLEVQLKISALENKYSEEDKVCLFVCGCVNQKMFPLEMLQIVLLKVTLLTESSLNYKNYPWRYFGQEGT